MKKSYTYNFALVACLLAAGCASEASDVAEHEQQDQEEAPSAQVATSAARWTSGGQNYNNTRHQDQETRISPQTVGSLKQKWSYRTSGGIGATPAVDETAVYVVDNSGAIAAVDRRRSGR